MEAPLVITEKQRLASAIRRWKEKLLDLTMRNRAINFKVNKVSTVTIVDELPGQVFEFLSIREQLMKFKPVLPEPSKTPGSRTSHLAEAQISVGGDGESFDLADVDDGIEMPALEVEDVGNQHADDLLQAYASPSNLDKSLRRLSEQAQTTIEEQGVNVLYLTLGMLHYRNPLEPDRELRAPIILLPVTLNRRSARTGFTIKAGDDEPVVNPSLTEYLRQIFDVTLPTIPDSASIRDNYNLQDLLDEVARLVRDRKDWSVEPEIYLGLFSFQKLAMYRDLETNAEQFLVHRLIRQIVTRDSQYVAGLPPDVRNMDLDKEFPPEATAQVVDADSSQLRAIAAVVKGYDLVLEGPPGTGKSQTITNLIGQALHDGKSVLFVAEKMAALNVVHRRLEEAGLGHFCLELHSTKTNKRAVLQSIRVALDASIETPAISEIAANRLPGLRASLTEYANTIHSPYGMLGISPFFGYGELGAVLNAPKFRLSRGVSDATGAQVTDTVLALEVLARVVDEIGDPNTHPWRDSKRTFYTQSDLDDAEDILNELIIQLQEVQHLSREVEYTFGLSRICRLDDIRTAFNIASVLEISPGAPIDVLTSEAWNAPPPQARDLVVRGRKIKAIRDKLDSKLIPEVFEQDHKLDIAFIEEKEAGIFRFLNFLNSRYRLITKRWKAYRVVGYTPSIAEQIEDMRKASDVHEDRKVLAGAETDAHSLFGGIWRGESSEWDILENYISWVVEFRSACVKHNLTDQAAAVAAQPHPDTTSIRKLVEIGEVVQALLKRLRTLVGWQSNYLADISIEGVQLRIKAMLEALSLATRWAAYEAARATVATSLAEESISLALSGELAFSDLPQAFKRAFYQKWLDGVVQDRPVLREFHTLSHEKRVQEFQELDRRVLLDNRGRLVGLLRDRTQRLLQSAESKEGLGFLRTQLVRQRGHAPLRRTLQAASTAIRAIKPCFLMSPLTVAQLLDGTAEQFDLVVFDEASQLTSEDAVGAMMRGRQLVVVGDPKQLPPTNFFAVTSGQVITDTDENGDPIVEESESVLEECAGAGLPRARLKWHYRSREESLITFSNASFYDYDLLTFPSVFTDAHLRGLNFEYVASGIYDGGGLNPLEARHVANAVVHHAKTQPDMSLGIGTFNMRQQIAILDELEVRRRQDPSLEPFFASGKDEPFFVKNLENIQGDERDVIFLSITYAKGKEGVLRHNFGPINGENGWRRLNVITTRARHQMRVFSSMHGDEIDLTKTNSIGARLLREFLLYAEHGHLDSLIVKTTAQAESGFEADVMRELTLRGVRLQPQVGVAGYRIDMGVLDEEVSGRFICGIECDGAGYHSSPTARDRDRLRQQVLEGRGWALHRIWSTDWFKDRQGQIERILQLVDESRRRGREHVATFVLTPLINPEESANPLQLSVPREQQPIEPDPVPTSDQETPAAEPYRMAQLNRRDTPDFGLEFHEIGVHRLLTPLQLILKTEAPLHIKDLATRLANAYDNRRVGSRITEHIDRLCHFAERKGVVRRQGDFIWSESEDLVIRSRTGTSIPADRISPEELQAGIIFVLESTGAMDREALVVESRKLFGYNRTGAQVSQVFNAAIDDLVLLGRIGEGGSGMALRN